MPECELTLADLETARAVMMNVDLHPSAATPHEALVAKFVRYYEAAEADFEDAQEALGAQEDEYVAKEKALRLEIARLSEKLVMLSGSLDDISRQISEVSEEFDDL